MVVKHVFCTDRSQSKLEHIAQVFPWGCLGTSCSALWQALPCPATSKNIFNPRCQLHPARWSGIFLLWFQTDPAKMALSHQLYVTHCRAVSLRSASFEWLLSHKCDTVTFLRDLWGKDQSSLICETGTLLLLNDLFRGAGEHTATSNPRKAQFQAPEAPGVKLGAMDSHLTTHLLERRRADTLKMPRVILGPCWHPARVRLAGAAEADACPRLPAEALPSSDYPVEGKRYEWNPQSKSVVCSWNPSLS